MNKMISQETSYQEEEHMALNILVVDDEPQVSLVTAKMIEKMGHVAVMAESCKQAIHNITENNFDLVLLDMGLPDGRGIQLIPEIRKIAGDVNIVIMTGTTSWDVEQEVRGSKVMYYLLKPFSFDELRSIVDHLNNKRIGIELQKVKQAGDKRDV